MGTASVQAVGNLALGLSLTMFAVYFLNVLIGGPLGKEPWMNDLWEMLTLFVAVLFFVVGTLCREAQLARGKADLQTGSDG